MQWNPLDGIRPRKGRPCKAWSRTVERECKVLNKTWSDMKQLAQARVRCREGSRKLRRRTNYGVPQASLSCPTLFLLFLNDLLCLTTNSILFSILFFVCRWQQPLCYNAQPRLYEVGVSRNCMQDTLNSDLVKIEEWERANRVEFNHAKLNAVCYCTSESQIMAKTFVCTVVR